MRALPSSRRILVLGSPFLRSLVRTIVADADDLELADELDPESDVLDAAGRTDADFVIVGVRDLLQQDLYLQLLEQRPRIKVLAVDGEGHDASLWELRPQRTLLGEISAQKLLEAIRSGDWRSAAVA